MFDLIKAKKEYPHFFQYHSFYNFAKWMTRFENKGEMTLDEALDFIYKKELKNFLFDLKFYKVLILANKLEVKFTANIINQLTEYIVNTENNLGCKEIKLFYNEFDTFATDLINDLPLMSDRPLREFADIK